MRKVVIFFVLCVLSWGSLYSFPAQKILHPGDWAYDALAMLGREQGRVFFADSRITVMEMEQYLEEIDTAALSESGLAVYDRLAAYLQSGPRFGFQSDILSGGLDVMVQPEFYYKTNEHNKWTYNAYERNPVLQLPWGFSFGPYLSAEMDLYFGENEDAAFMHDNYVNVPVDLAYQTDIHFPKRAYISAGLPVGKASGFNAAFGLGDNFYGRTRTGSIILSEYLQRTIYAQASAYSPLLKYTAQVLQYEVNKYHYMHYLQVRPHRIVSVSLAEGVMVSAPLEFRFLNPFTIFHSYESYKTYANYNKDLGHVNDGTDTIYDLNGFSRIGSYLGLRLEVQPLRNLRLYGLFVMDQYNPSIEKKSWGSALDPDALGFQAGTEFSIPVRKGYWEFGLEGVYTYPYMYVLWDKSWSFYKEVPEAIHTNGRPAVRYWTGTPFGPDTIAGSFWAGFHSSAGWYSALSFTFSAQGERSDLSIFDRDNSLDDTYRPSNVVVNVTVPPTGIPVLTYIASLKGEYSWKWFSFMLQPGYRVEVNAGHEEGRIEHGFEIALSVRYKP